MTLAAFVVFVVAVLSVVAVHAWSLHRTFERQRERDERDEARQEAVYKQQKAAQRQIAQTERATQILADQSRALHEEAKHVLMRTDAFFKHPEARRMIEEQQNG